MEKVEEDGEYTKVMEGATPKRTAIGPHRCRIATM